MWTENRMEGGEMKYWESKVPQLTEVYSTATSHLEANLMLKEKYGFKAPNASALGSIASLYRISRLLVTANHRGRRKGAGKKKRGSE